MGQCIAPLYLTKQSVSVSCGKCLECKKNRIAGWSFRLMQEAKRSRSALFVTLTYDTDFVPITKNGFMSLDKTDVQKFIKRYRKYDKNNVIKYYAVGEYGSNTRRPHYHLIMFNADESIIDKAWRKENVPIGQIHIGKLTEASAGYTLKYITKEKKVGKFGRDDRAPEFSLMSKKLGANYLSSKMLRWHKTDLLNRYYLPLLDGKKASMPRYYKEKIYSHWQRLKISQHLQNQAIKEEKRQLQGKNVRQVEEFYLQKFRISAEKFRKSHIDSRLKTSI